MAEGAPNHHRLGKLGENGAGDGEDDVVATERELVGRLDENLRLVVRRAKSKAGQHDNNHYVRFEARHHDNNDYVLVYTPEAQVLNYSVDGRTLHVNKTYQGITREMIHRVALKRGTLEMLQNSG